jgi:hypothetical protein
VKWRMDHAEARRDRGQLADSGTGGLPRPCRAGAPQAWRRHKVSRPASAGRQFPPQRTPIHRNRENRPGRPPRAAHPLAVEDTAPIRRTGEVCWRRARNGDRRAAGLDQVDIGGDESAQPGRCPVRIPASTTRHSAVNVLLRHVRCPTLEERPNQRIAASYRRRSIRA